MWWDEEKGTWTGHDVPDFVLDKAPSYRPQEGQGGPEGLAGDDPFIMQADGKAWLFAPSGLLDGPLPAHYEPQESPVANPLYSQQSNPTRQVFKRTDNLQNPSGTEPHADVFPYVFTTYRLTEHHTAGGMSRWLPYLSELQPEFFCEVSPELARERGLEHLGWATIVSARTAIEARVMVTDRVSALTVGGRTVHQIGLPYHWGVGGEGALVSGDSANDLFGVTLDANVHIQETKVASCDIRPGRRPTGPALLEYVAAYQRRAGITVETGNQQRTPARPTSSTGCTRVEDPHDEPGRPAVRTERPRTGRGLAGPAAQGVLHRHDGLHRLQGLRGRLQGVERGSRGRAVAARPVLRQHRRARRQHVASRRLRRAARPERGPSGGRARPRAGRPRDAGPAPDRRAR